MRVTEATSQKIKNMSLLCAAFVVILHSWVPTEFGSPLWLVRQLVVEGIARIAVPFFFVVSGFFLAAHFSETGWWGREIKKRLSTLVIPFFIWSLLFIITSVPLSIFADLIAHRPFGTNIEIFKDTNYLRIFGVDLTIAPLLTPLWYVRCLFFFILAAPIISKCVAKLRYTWLIACFAALLVYAHLVNPTFHVFFIHVFSLPGLFYFSVGIFIQLTKPKAPTTTLAIVFGVVGIALLIAKTICLAPHHSALGQPFVPFLLVATWHFMSAKRLPDWLTSCSFPIFLMHLFFFPYVGVAFRNLHLTQCHPALQPTINFLVGFFGSIAVTLLLRKHLPRTARVLFGGR